MSLLLRRFGTPCVPHGMRSSFRDWCSETGREVAEKSPWPHVVKNKGRSRLARSGPTGESPGTDGRVE